MRESFVAGQLSAAYLFALTTRLAKTIWLKLIQRSPWSVLARTHGQLLASTTTMRKREVGSLVSALISRQSPFKKGTCTAPALKCKTLNGSAPARLASVQAAKARIAIPLVVGIWITIDRKGSVFRIQQPDLNYRLAG